MAGVKRKLAAAQEQSAETTAQPAETSTESPFSNTPGGRVTRSSRGNRGLRSDRLGRMVILRGRSLIGNTIGQSASQDPIASVPDPETPRPKRARRAPNIDDTPRTTRSSARLKAHTNPAENANTSADDVEENQQSLNADPVSDGNTLKDNIENTEEENDFSDQDLVKPFTRSPSSHDTGSDRAEQSPVKPADHETSNLGIESSMGNEPSKPAVADGSHIPTGEKRSLPEDDVAGDSKLHNSPIPPLENDHVAAKVESTAASVDQNPKAEEDEADRVLEQQLQSGTEELPTQSPVDDAIESTVPNGSRLETEDIEMSGPEDGVASTTSTVRGRGRGRGARGRGRGRGGRSTVASRIAKRSSKRGTGRGRGGRTRAGKGRANDSSDIEFARPLSPNAATQRLRDRQRELEKLFKRVAAAQRLALNVVATHNQRRLARDKNAHKNVPEFDEVQRALAARLRARERNLRLEHEVRVEQENRLFEAEKERIERKFRDSARHIQAEHLKASQGEYMAFVEGRQAAEDDEHTEPEDSDSEAERGMFAHLRREFLRGFNSPHVRDIAGAAAYQRADTGWDDFVQRARLGGDLSPQMREIAQEGGGPFAGLPAGEVIALLLEATKSTGASERLPGQPGNGAAALHALADVATAESRHTPLPPFQTTPASRHPSGHRAILPQPSQHVTHGPTDPRSFVLPRPTPQRQQPRRLLPAGQMLHINEQSALPNPFSALGGPPQLPPPPGSNFQRPPPPGYVPGSVQPIYYPPPHPFQGPRHPYQ